MYWLFHDLNLCIHTITYLVNPNLIITLKFQEGKTIRSLFIKNPRDKRETSEARCLESFDGYSSKLFPSPATPQKSYKHLLIFFVRGARSKKLIIKLDPRHDRQRGTVRVNYADVRSGRGDVSVPFSNSGRMEITGRAEGCHCRLRRLVARTCRSAPMSRRH